MPPVLDIRDVRRRYGRVEALRGISLQLDQPGIYGFLGPNGAGKTTAIKLIAGLLRPHGGTVAINGHDVQSNPVDARRQLGVMMESPAFYHHLTGRDNLRYVARACGWADNGSIARLLDRVGLSAKAGIKVGGYSRGMRQRLGLAAALLGDPTLLVLDEPTNGLDPGGIAEMRRWLQQLASDERRTVLLSSHQMGEVERVCDRVTIIDQGAIIAEGPTREIVQAKSGVLIRTPNIEDAFRMLQGTDGVDSVERVDAQTLRVLATRLTASDINRLLTTRGLEVTGVSEERETLEDAFFRLVGRRHDVA